MSKKCRDCFHFYGVTEDMNGEVGMCELQSSDCPNYKVAGQNACKMFNAQTLFDRITASPEVLAPKLVYRSFIRRKELRGNGLFLEWKPIKIKCYKSKVISGVHYKNSTEAIAATVAKLKEFCDAERH